MKTPEKSVLGRRDGKNRAQLTWPARYLLHMQKGTEMEARTSRHMRVKKLPIGCLLFLNFNYASRTLMTVLVKRETVTDEEHMAHPVPSSQLCMGAPSSV